MPHFERTLWRLRNCRIIQLVVTVFNNRHIITATTYTFFCSGFWLEIVNAKYGSWRSLERMFDRSNESWWSGYLRRVCEGKKWEVIQ